MNLKASDSRGLCVCLRTNRQLLRVRMNERSERRKTEKEMKKKRKMSKKMKKKNKMNEKMEKEKEEGGLKEEGQDRVSWKTKRK